MGKDNFDPTKPVKTRHGMKARILCTDAKRGGKSIVALIERFDGLSEFFMDYYPGGTVAMTPLENNYDLINVTDGTE